MRLEPADIRRLSPQTLTFFEFKGRRDLDIVRKAYRLHPPFGQGLMPKLGLKYRTEFHMGNMAFLFRTRAWLRPTAAPRNRARPGERQTRTGIRRGATSSGQSPLVRRLRRRGSGRPPRPLADPQGQDPPPL